MTKDKYQYYYAHRGYFKGRETLFMMIVDKFTRLRSQKQIELLKKYFCLGYTEDILIMLHNAHKGNLARDIKVVKEAYQDYEEVKEEDLKRFDVKLKSGK